MGKYNAELKKSTGPHPEGPEVGPAHYTMMESPDKPAFTPPALRSRSIYWNWFPALCFLAGCLFASSAQAQYRQGVLVGDFNNPPGWKEPYDPGGMVRRTLLNRGKGHPALILTGPGEAPSSPGPETRQESGDGSSGNAGTPQGPLPPAPVQFRVEGQVLKFAPRVPLEASDHQDEAGGREVAEVVVHMRVIHQVTGRSVAETKLWAVGRNGGLSFGASPDTYEPGHPDFQNTSLGQALETLADRTLNYLEDHLSTRPLDAQVIRVDPETERLWINVGEKHRVQVRDRFVIYRIQPRVKDPFTQADLGDGLERMGEIQVNNVAMGFAEAVILGGGDFKQGDLARARRVPTPKSSRLLEFLARKKESGPSFRPPRNGLHAPPAGVFGLEVSPLFGLRLGF